MKTLAECDYFFSEACFDIPMLPALSIPFFDRERIPVMAIDRFKFGVALAASGAKYAFRGSRPRHRSRDALLHVTCILSRGPEVSQHLL
jgi:hypothetical protein